MRTLALVIACSLLPLTAAAMHAVVRPSVVVAGPAITVGDVADVSGADAAQVDRLRATEVAKSPRAGYPKQLSRADLARAVRPVIDPSRLTWSGAEAMTVETAATTVSGAEIADSAALYLFRILGGDRQRTTVRPVDLPQDVLVASGAVELRPRPLPYSEALRRQARVWIDILVNGRHYRSVAVSFAVEVWHLTWTPRADLPRGQALSCDALERREARIEGLGDPFDGPCNGADLRLRRLVRAGDVLVAAAVEAVPAVSQGRAVRLRVRVGDVVLEWSGTAMGDAGFGQRVPVRSAVGGAVLQARVTAAGEARVHAN